MTITVGLVKYITASQKIHFALLNFVAVDIAFIGTRTLGHLLNSTGSTFIFIWTMLIYTILVLDLLEMVKLQSSIKYVTFKELRGEKVILQKFEPENKSIEIKDEIMERNR